MTIVVGQMIVVAIILGIAGPLVYCIFNCSLPWRRRIRSMIVHSFRAGNSPELTPSQVEALGRSAAEHQSRIIQRSIDAVFRRLDDISRRINAMGLDVSKLIEAAAHQKTVDDSVLAFMAEQKKQLEDVSKQLADLRAAGEVDTSAVQAQIDSAAAAMETEAGRMAAAIATPAASASDPATPPSEAPAQS